MNLRSSTYHRGKKLVSQVVVIELSRQIIKLNLNIYEYSVKPTFYSSSMFVITLVALLHRVSMLDNRVVMPSIIPPSSISKARFQHNIRERPASVDLLQSILL